MRLTNIVLAIAATSLWGQGGLLVKSPEVKSYLVSKDRNQRAIAGLSMGGDESLYIGLNYLDHFAYIGSFSGAFVMWPRANPPAADAAPAMGASDFEKNFPSLNAKTSSQMRLAWIACNLEGAFQWS